MITTVKLNIEVKDEFNGMYNYLAEVFTTNPLTDATATLLLQTMQRLEKIML